jgi:DNA-directed RNA polymerase II subunit RPB2
MAESLSILKTYFEENPYALTKHHLDSYNQFVTKKLIQTVASMNPVEVVKMESKTSTIVKHTITVVIGGSEPGAGITISKPKLIDPYTGEDKMLLPNECRMLNYTYAADVYANITITYTYRDEAPVEQHLMHVKIATIPVMLRSVLCNLNDVDPIQAGECEYDRGGYFIIDGKEKVVVAQERNATNYLFVNKSNEPDKYTYEAFIRCTAEENSVFPKTIYFKVFGDFMGRSRANAITMRIPHIDMEIPVWLVFRLLGVVTDKSILKHIVGDNLETQEAKQMCEFLYASIREGAVTYTTLDTAKLLANHVRFKSVENVYYIVNNNLFPNITDNSLNTKALYLGYLVNKLIKIALGLQPESDRDNYMYKRIGISGFLLADVFKDYYNKFRVDFWNKIDSEYELRQWTRYDGSLAGKLNEMVFNSNIITSGLFKSLKGSWGIDGVQGIVQDLARISYQGFLSHLRRVSSPVDESIKIRRPHQLLASHFGYVCPSESPDGGSIGLIKNMSLMCHISFDVPSRLIAEAFTPFKLSRVGEPAFQFDPNATMIFINHNWYANVSTERAPQIVEYLRLLRRNAAINIFTSISWNIITKEIHVLTENGRCTRPLIIVGKGNKLTIPQNKSWYDMIMGTSEIAKAQDIYSTRFVDPFAVYGTTDIKVVMSNLRKTAATIEFIDVEESNNCMIAMRQQDVDPSNSILYTHCEIHPSTMFSVYTLSIPFLNHNAPTRIVFSGAQGKQAIGVYATNFYNRIDTMSYVLHYPQKPLVKTYFSDYTNATDMPNGENLIVAICTYTGYNQEDSIIVNRAAIDRGMFNLTYYKCITTAEEKPNSIGEKVIFKSPLDVGVSDTSKLNTTLYSKLDDSGFPVQGSFITQGDAIVGKFFLSKEGVTNGDNAFEYKNKTLFADRTISGYVDKVVVFRNKENVREVKIRMRKYRRPELGDKMCLTPDHDVLTHTGWKSIKDVTKNDLVCARNQEGYMVWELPRETYCYDCDDEPLLDVNSTHVELRVTLNHKMFVKLEGHKEFGLYEARQTFGSSVTYAKSAKNLESREYYLNELQKLVGNQNVFYTQSWAEAEIVQKLALQCEWSADIYVAKDLFVVLIHKQSNITVNAESSKFISYTGKVYCIEVPSHVFYVRKNGKAVWTGNSSRHGQKGVAGMILPPEDMPFSRDGITPDIIINPHAFPSRLTIGHLMEAIVAKVCAVKGFEYNALPYEKHDLSTITEYLTSAGFNPEGDELLMNGFTGEQIPTQIFITPTYYYRLKHMVADKINYRTTGRLVGLTKQPTKGRSNEGGLRIGEMETNAIISHGISGFLKESFIERSDKYNFYVDEDTKTIAACPTAKPKTQKFTPRIMSPYAFKLLLQELQTMAIKPSLVLDEEADDDAMPEEIVLDDIYEDENEAEDVE